MTCPERPIEPSPPTALEQGRAALSCGDFALAEELFRGVLSDPAASHPDRIDARTELASEVLRPQGRHDQAAEVYREALAEARSLADLSRQARSLTGLAVLEMHADQPERASRRLIEALALARAAKDRREEGIVLGNLGSVQLLTGRVDEALDAYRRSVAIDREAGDRRGEAIGTGNIAMLELTRGDARAAAHHYAEALAVATTLGSRLHASHLRGQLGQVHLVLGEIDAARSELAAALEVSRELGDRSQQAFQLGVLANVEARHGLAADALRLYDEALAAAGQGGDHRIEGLIVADLGALELELGQLKSAHGRYRRAESLARHAGNRRLLARVFVRLAELFELQGGLPEAASFCEDAVELVQQIGDGALEVAALTTLGHLRDDLGQSDSADQCLRRAAARLEPLDLKYERGRLESALAHHWWLRGDHDECARRHALAIGAFRRLGCPREEARALMVEAAEWMEQSDPDRDRAMSHCERALRIASACGGAIIEGTALRLLAALRRHAGDLDESARLAGEALRVADSIGAPGPIGLALIEMIRSEGARDASVGLLQDRLSLLLLPMRGHLARQLARELASS